MEDILKLLDLRVLIGFITTNFFKLLPGIILIILYTPIKRYTKYLLNRFYVRIFKENKGVISFLNSLSSFIIDLILIITILRVLGVNLSGVTALFGALSLVFGFAFKDTLGNMFGGIILLVFKPFVIGDVVQIGTHNGRVVAVEIFYTHLLTFTNEEIIIPNGNIVNSEVKNITMNELRRIDITIGVGYGSNIDQVKSIISEIVERKRGELFELDFNPLIVGMNNIGASSLNFDIKVHVKSQNYLAGRYYLNESIKTEFDKAGIELPYNIIDLQINNEFNNLNIKERNED